MTQMSTDVPGGTERDRSDRDGENESPQITYDTSQSRSYTLLVPFVVGLFMAVLAVVFSILGVGVPAGVSAAIALFFIVLSLLGYAVFWLLGRMST